MAQLINLRGAATLLGCSPVLVKRLLREGVLHAQKVGASYLIGREEVEAKTEQIRQHYKFGWKHGAGRGQRETLVASWGLPPQTKKARKALEEAKRHVRAEHRGERVDKPLVDDTGIRALQQVAVELVLLRQMLDKVYGWLDSNWSTQKAEKAS